MDLGVDEISLLESEIDRLVEENKAFKELTKRLLKKTPRASVDISSEVLLHQRDRALELVQDLLDRIEKLTVNRDYKKVLLETELLRYQLKDLKQQAITTTSTIEQNQKLIEKETSKKSKLFDW